MESIVFVLPVLLIGVALAVLFALWLFAVLGSMYFDPALDKALIALALALGAIGSLAYLINVVILTAGYVIRGREVLIGLGPLSRWLLFLGPLFSLGWAFVAISNYGSRSDTPITATAVLFLPGLLLIPPSLHLICAAWIADYHSLRRRTP
jgi:hypothetical protein